MNRLYPAEARLKEGANARNSGQYQVGVIPLPRGGGALSARYQEYRKTSHRCQLMATLQAIANESALALRPRGHQHHRML